MSATPKSSSRPSTAAAKLPPSGSAVEAWDAICRGMGITPMSAEEAASLPPMTDEEADAFERVIQEAFEQVEEPETLR